MHMHPDARSPDDIVLTSLCAGGVSPSTLRLNSLKAAVLAQNLRTRTLSTMLVRHLLLLLPASGSEHPVFNAYTFSGAFLDTACEFIGRLQDQI